MNKARKSIKKPRAFIKHISRFAGAHQWLVVAAVIFMISGSMGAIRLLESAHAATLSLCGNSGTPPSIKHVVVVMMENKSYKQVVGNANAPYQTSLASQCGNAAAAFGATHTSAANYLAVSVGQYPAASPPGCGTVAKCADASENLYHQLDTAGLSWKGYAESMGSPCNPTSSFPYKIGHNPAIFYSDISAAECQANDVSVDDLTAQSGAFWNDLQNQTLPSLSWVSPNQNDDNEANDGPGGISANTAEQMGDTWLQKFLGTVQQSNSYQAGNTAILVAYDEGNGSDNVTGEDCTNQSLDMPVTNNTSTHQDSCHVPLFVVYPYTAAGTKDGTFFDHYSITKTIEDLFGLPYLAHAGDAQTASMIGHFGLNITNGAASKCAAPAGGMSELSGNLSLESAQTGWTGTYNSNSSVSRIQPAGGSYDGLWALQVKPKAAGAAGVNNAAPLWADSTTAGAAYIGSAFVRANTAGQTISVIVRETSPSGAGVGSHTSTLKLSDTNWHQISSTYTAVNSGDMLHFNIYNSNFTATSQYFQLDCLSLQSN